MVSVFEAVDQFYYLGNILSTAHGALTAAISRCQCAWGIIRQNLPLLTACALPLKIHDRLFNSDFTKTLLHATVTWQMSLDVLHRQCLNNHAMIC